MTLITIQEAAKIMGTNRTTLYGRIHRSIGYHFPSPAGKKGQTLMYSKAEVLDFKARNPIYVASRWTEGKKAPKAFVYDGLKLEMLLFLQPKLRVAA